jgi:hypothetical protein
VAAEPVGKDIGRPVVEQIDRAVRLEVEQQGPYRRCFFLSATSSTPSTRGPRLSSVSFRACSSRRSVSGLIGRPTLRARRAPPSPSSLQGKRDEQAGGTTGTASIASQGAIEALREDLARAGWNIAEPAATVDTRADRLATPGKVEWATNIATVLPATQLTALRTRHQRSCWLDHKDQAAIALDHDQDDYPTWRLGLKRPAIVLLHESHASAISCPPEEA